MRQTVFEDVSDAINRVVGAVRRRKDDAAIRTLLSTLPALARTLLSTLLSLPALRSRLLYLLARALLYSTTNN